MKAGVVPSVNFPDGLKGETRDIVGTAIGMSGPTYQRAKAVVEDPAGRERPHLPSTPFRRLYPTPTIPGCTRDVPGANLSVSRQRGRYARSVPINFQKERGPGAMRVGGGVCAGTRYGSRPGGGAKRNPLPRHDLRRWGTVPPS